MQAEIKDSILGQIIARKWQEIAAQQKKYSRADLEQLAAAAPSTRGFAKALAHKSPAIIAEIKKASPSKGVIRQDFQPAQIAAQYQAAGAACLSVLTDVDFFQGAHQNIALAHQSCDLPILRKDFMVDPYHIIESRALQADCVLLIVAALSDMQLQELAATAFEHQLDVLVEVHNEQEMQRALQLPAGCLLGINNRNLKTFEVDLNTTVRLKNMLSDSQQVITESGISSPAEVAFMREHAVDRFLVGEGFMRQADPGQALQALFGQPSNC